MHADSPTCSKNETRRQSHKLTTQGKRKRVQTETQVSDATQPAVQPHRPSVPPFTKRILPGTHDLNTGDDHNTSCLQTLTLETGDLVTRPPRAHTTDSASLHNPEPLAARCPASHRFASLDGPYHAAAPGTSTCGTQPTNAHRCPIVAASTRSPEEDEARAAPSESGASVDGAAAGSSAAVVTQPHVYPSHNVAPLATQARTPTSTAVLFPPAPPLPTVAPMGQRGRRVFLYGNYHAYYGYRLGQEFDEDPRLALLQRDWFARRRCMDVGCNEGLLTLALARSFGARSMVGVDLDDHLIARACQNLRQMRTAAVAARGASRKAGVSASERRSAKVAVSALAQTWFVHADFLEARAEEGSIDMLTAFSVTKWIHLHRGDEGLLAFFARVCSLLSPGGLFVLEPQPWRSYKSAKHKLKQAGGRELLPQHAYFHRMHELQLRPETFPELLEERFGLRLMRRMQCPGEDARGFDRGMYLFRKAVPR